MDISKTRNKTGNLTTREQHASVDCKAGWSMRWGHTQQFPQENECSGRLQNRTRDIWISGYNEKKKMTRKLRKISWKSSKCVKPASWLGFPGCSRAPEREWDLDVWLWGLSWEDLKSVNSDKSEKENEINGPALFPLLKLPLQNALSLQRMICLKCCPFNITQKSLLSPLGIKLCKSPGRETFEMPYIYLHFFFPPLLLKFAHLL